MQIVDQAMKGTVELGGGKREMQGLVDLLGRFAPGARPGHGQGARDRERRDEAVALRFADAGIEVERECVVAADELCGRLFFIHCCNLGPATAAQSCQKCQHDAKDERLLHDTFEASRESRRVDSAARQRWLPG